MSVVVCELYSIGGWYDTVASKKRQWNIEVEVIMSEEGYSQRTPYRTSSRPKNMMIKSKV